MKNILAILIICLSIAPSMAQTKKNAADDEIKPTFVEHPLTSNPSKSATKPSKTGGQAAATTPALTETIKAVKTFMETSPQSSVANKNDDKQDIADPDDTKKIAETTTTPTVKEEKKDINTISYHETFAPTIPDAAEVEISDSIFVSPSNPAEFPGGTLAMKKFIEENIKVPQLPDNEKVQGRVFISFVVSKKGELEQVRLIKGLRDEYNNEAIKVIRKMPRWEPAHNHGNKVRYYCSIPIVFKK